MVGRDIETECTGRQAHIFIFAGGHPDLLAPSEGRERYRQRQDMARRSPIQGHVRCPERDVEMK